MASSCVTPSKKLTENLKSILIENEGYEFVSWNGQRIFKPSVTLNLEEPPKGSEVFIGNIPRNVFEDELIPMFQQIGKLFKFRLMLDFNDRTRGFAFATYFNPYNANKSIELFNGYEIRNGTFIGVFKSVDNRRLFVGNIPMDKSSEDIELTLKSAFTDMKKVHMYSNWCDKNLNKRYVFLEFEDHALAANARKLYFPKRLLLWGVKLYVDWADPIPEVDPAIMNKIKILYLTNLPFHMSEAELIESLSGFHNFPLIQKVHKVLNYAFIHCFTKDDAELLMDKLKGVRFNDQLVEVEWARPRVHKKTSNNMIANMNHFCLSVSSAYRRAVRNNSPKYNKYNSAMAKSDGSGSFHTNETTSSPSSSEDSWATHQKRKETGSKLQLFS